MRRPCDGGRMTEAGGEDRIRRHMPESGPCYPLYVPGARRVATSPAMSPR